jgi:hypothetical protein
VGERLAAAVEPLQVPVGAQPGEVAVAHRKDLQDLQRSGIGGQASGGGRGEGVSGAVNREPALCRKREQESGPCSPAWASLFCVQNSLISPQNSLFRCAGNSGLTH